MWVLSICRFTLAQSFPCLVSSIRNGGGAYGWAYPGFTMLDRKEDEHVLLGISILGHKHIHNVNMYADNISTTPFNF